MSVFNLCGLIAKVNPSDFAAHADLTVLSFELVPKRFPHWYVCAPFVYKYQVHTYTHAYTGMHAHTHMCSIHIHMPMHVHTCIPTET